MALLLVCACVCGFGGGCDGDRLPLCFVGDDEAVQVSPSGRAVVFVDPDSFQAILQAPLNVLPALECAVDEYVSRFDIQPEAIVFALNLEERIMTRPRLMHERGFNFFEDVSQLSEDELEKWRQAVEETNQIVENLPDQPDYAFNSMFRKLEEGTGFREYNVCSELCPDTLRGYVFLPAKESLVAGRFLHEFGHFWGAHLQGPPELRSQIDRYDGHWGFSSVGGLLGGWDPDSLVALGDDLYEADVFPAGKAVNTFTYAPLELYLMGLAGPEEVPPIQVAVGAEYMGETEEGLRRFHADRLVTVTIEDIIAAHGPRVPSFEDSPKEFPVALVVLSDHELSEVEWDFYEHAIDFLEAPEDAQLSDFFTEERYAGHREIWESLSIDNGLQFLNFAGSTGGRGRFRFSKIESPPE